MTKLSPIHPGEILKEDYLSPLGLSVSAFARKLGVPTNRISRIVNGSSAVTAETSILLAKALRTTPTFWLNLQSRYELQLAQDKSPSLDHIKPVIAA